MNTSVKLSLALAAAALDTCTLLLTAAGSVGAHETTLAGIVLRAEDAERRATAACEQAEASRSAAETAAERAERALLAVKNLRARARGIVRGKPGRKPAGARSPRQAPMMGTTTDTDGNYIVGVARSEGSVTITPRKNGHYCGAVSSLDAAYILQYLTGRRDLTREQLLACDVTGNGTCSALDSAKIMQFTVGKIRRFPAAEKCGSDWLFIPKPPKPGVDGAVVIEPRLDESGCTPGAVVYDNIGSQPDALGQDFVSILIGDVTGNWQPCEDPPR